MNNRWHFRFFGYFVFMGLMFGHSAFAQETGKKTLVVLLAETRAYELTYDNIKANLLDPLNADLALCIGVKDNYCYENPFYQNAQYRFLYPEPEDYGSAFDYAYETILAGDPSITTPFPWRKFLQIKDQFLGGIKDPYDQHPGSAGILLFFRWFLLKNILENGLLDKYDFFVITRSDYLYTLPHPQMEVFSKEHIYVPDGEWYGGVTDRHVVLPKEFVVPYLNILNNMISRGEEYYRKMQAQGSHWNLESLIKFHLIQNHVWERVRFFPYVMYTVRPINGTTRWATGVFSEAHNCFIKYPSEYQISHKHREDFEKERCDLNTFYRNRISR